MKPSAVPCRPMPSLQPRRAAPHPTKHTSVGGPYQTPLQPCRAGPKAPFDLVAGEWGVPRRPLAEEGPSPTGQTLTGHRSRPLSALPGFKAKCLWDASLSRKASPGTGGFWERPAGRGRLRLRRFRLLNCRHVRRGSSLRPICALASLAQSLSFGGGRL